jgi:hypothetical protein
MGIAMLGEGVVMEREDFKRLERELAEARESHRKAQQEARRCAELLAKLQAGHPEGTRALTLANVQLSGATRRYLEAAIACMKYSERVPGRARRTLRRGA